MGVKQKQVLAAKAQARLASGEKVCAAEDCHKTGVPQSFDQFYLDRNTADGHNRKCKTCCSKISHDYRRSHWGAIALTKLKGRSKGMQIDLHPDELEDMKGLVDKCPYFGTDLVYTNNLEWSDQSATIDRISSQHGYTSSNIEIISHRANRIKSDATEKELVLLAKRCLIKAGISTEELDKYLDLY
jgi:hypothetical protein